MQSTQMYCSAVRKQDRGWVQCQVTVLRTVRSDGTPGFSLIFSWPCLWRQKWSTLVLLQYDFQCVCVFCDRSMEWGGVRRAEWISQWHWGTCVKGASLHNALNETGVQVNDEHAQERHLLACVLKDDSWVIRLAAEAVGGHHHGKVIDIHLSNRHISRLSKHLGIISGGQGEKLWGTESWNWDWPYSVLMIQTMND